tara:strand:- start:11 stop:181 length:171 start_codon:yes stop_codon:yes gene_type:complete
MKDGDIFFDWLIANKYLDLYNKAVEMEIDPTESHYNRLKAQDYLINLDYEFMSNQN